MKTEHVENFTSLYANSAIFEPTAWDLRIVFGQVEPNTEVVKQQVAITIPWAQAKLALYYLRAHVELMEEQTGKIGIRRDIIPSELPPLTSEQGKDPVARRAHELVQRLRAEFIASLE